MEGVSMSEVIQLPTGAKFNVLPVSNGNLLVMPIHTDPPPLVSYQTHMSSVAAQIVQASMHEPHGLATHTVTTPTLCTPMTTPSAEPLYHSSHGHPGMSGAVPEGVEMGGVGNCLGMDDSLADLQPEDSEGEEDTPTRPPLTQDQEKLEFMAALGLVPPAVLEEIHRRQKLCRAEYGNWWDRLHSTDFCLVPKSESTLQNLQIMAEEISMPVHHHDIQQVAAGPDAGALVEQITYLTSWPQPTTTEAVTTVEVETQQPTMEDHHTSSLVDHQRHNELGITQYLSLVADRHMATTVEEQAALQATIHQLASSFTLPHTT